MADKNREMAVLLARRVAERGGTAYYVGGCVRDRLRNIESTDVDVEVHGLYPAQLEAVLSSLGEYLAVGESFGVYTLKGCSLDIAMPRREEKRGAGHKDFAVSVDPFLGTYKAARRRDFTVNALYYDPVTEELLDFNGHGLEDIERGVVRAIGDAKLRFEEDPVRMLRALKLVGQYDFAMDAETENALFASLPLIRYASPSRLALELEKVLSSAYGDKHLKAFHDYGFLEYFLPYLNDRWDSDAMRYALELFT